MRKKEIHKIFIKRIGFTLIRVHREQLVSVNLTTQESLLQNLKWPIETMFVGMRTVALKTDLEYWTEFTQVAEQDFNMPNLVTSGSTFAGVTAAITTTGVSATYPVTVTPTYVQAKATAPVNTQLIDTITVTAHGIYLYNSIPSGFFNSYTTFTYGGSNIATPEDTGAFMIPFNLYPGSYQPSSHVNVSRAREFYFTYISSYIGTTVSSAVVSGELVVIALIARASGSQKDLLVCFPKKACEVVKLYPETPKASDTTCLE